MGLYQKYRPKRFEDVIGQEKQVKVLEKLLGNGFPHAVLLAGPSGTGKTTLARILARRLKCSKNDFKEINSASSRGIDTVRDIANRIGQAPWKGLCRVWLIDECFHGDTLVTTESGLKPIKDMRTDDVVLSVVGFNSVQRVFRNCPPLNRVVKLTFSDGRTIFTTVDHPFLTSKGWIEAGRLGKDVAIFADSCYRAGNSNLRGNHATNSDLWVLQQAVRAEEVEEDNLLLQEVCPETKEQELRSRTVREQGVPVLPGEVRLSNKQPEEVLQPVLCEEIRHGQGRVQGQNPQSGGEEEDRGCSEGRAEALLRREDEEKQSSTQAWCFGEDPADEGEEWHASCLEGREGRERQVDEGASSSIGNARWKLEAGISDHDWNEVALSSQLQSGSGASDQEIGGRGRWQFPQLEKEFIARCQKDRGFREIRVESVEVYEQGRNDQLFLGVIGDRELSQGYVEFFDLQVDGHPSYFTNGLPVHNCHGLTGDAQEALLKLLEDTPKHAYFFLATTNPSKLKPTIVTRCTEVKVTLLSANDLNLLIRSVLDKEGVKLSDVVIDKIISASEGSARKALVTLEQVYHLESEDDQIEAVEKSDTRRQGIEIAQCFFRRKKEDWGRVRDILKNLEDEPEAVRLIILGYARSVLLGTNVQQYARAMQVIRVFETAFYDGKQASLAANCYELIRE